MDMVTEDMFSAWKGSLKKTSQDLYMKTTPSAVSFFKQLNKKNASKTGGSATETTDGPTGTNTGAVNPFKYFNFTLGGSKTDAPEAPQRSVLLDAAIPARQKQMPREFRILVQSLLGKDPAKNKEFQVATDKYRNGVTSPQEYYSSLTSLFGTDLSRVLGPLLENLDSSKRKPLEKICRSHPDSSKRNPLEKIFRSQSKSDEDGSGIERGYRWVKDFFYRRPRIPVDTEAMDDFEDSSRQ
eukprot:CAMPEP_0185761620 /NCGR_PEP_ID=MMETSP1174-20130828/20566_1 /TAXON_ID=35687 /ORGANISM="Dictyocha speculum, Strain CCMP1381" /LENGTH=239 /DNA_ID=CAMNT_0028442937 /DNA_START=431 /DNA_END=1150 /DNA_ORIENTATION=+